MSIKAHKLFRLFSRTFALVLIFALASLIFVRLTAKADSLIGFNEGYGTTVHDSEGSASGTITNAVWRPASECLSGSCLYFDGTGDYVSFGDDANYDFAAATNWTVDFWFRTGDITSGTRVMVGKYRGDDVEGGYKIYMSSDGKVNFGVDDDNSWGPDDAATSINAYDDNAWHHVEAVKTGTTSLTLYVDAIRVGSDPSIQATGTLVNDDNFTLGMDSDGSSNPYTGFLDELKVHVSTARTADQVKLDYQKNSTTTGTSASFGPDTSFLTQGLVGYWKMDNALTDSSGNGYTLTNGGSTTFTGGKFGYGSEHVPGSSQYLYYTTTTISGVKSVSFWANPDALTDYYISLTSSANVQSNASGVISANGFTNPQIYVNGVAGNTLSANAWSLITATSDTAINADTFYIGRIGSNYYDGTMDEVRVYNRALSPTEVQQLYNWAPGPVGYWNMDENTGSYAYDSSGNGYTGTLTNGPVWTNGKFGSALNFNGSNNYVDLGSTNTLWYSTRPGTISFWTKLDGFATSFYPVVINLKSDLSVGFRIWYANDTGYEGINFGDANPYFVKLRTAGDISTSLTGTWRHVVLVYDGVSPTAQSSYKLYLDTVPQSLTTSGGVTDPPADSHIGTSDGLTDHFFDGLIDDVKIYNYARTPSQIVEDMNAGHPAPGSPVGSSVAHWKFDEGYSTTAYDSSTNSLNMTLSSASWTNSGKFGKAWNGDAAKWLSITDANSAGKLDFYATESATFTTWVKSDSASNPAGNEYIINKANATTAGYALYFNNAGKAVFAVDDDTTWTPDFIVTGSSDIYDVNWHQITAVKTAGSRMDLYVDGALNSTANVSIPNGDLNNSLAFYIGDRDGTDNGDEFTGDVDDTQVFRSALTADQVKLLYNQGFSASMGVLSTASASATMTSSARSYCPPGDTGTCNPPIAEWKMDEGSGNTSYDSSGNGYDLTLYNGMNRIVGKYGGGLKSINNNGIQEYAGTSDIDALDFSNTQDFTIGAWAKLGQTENNYYLIYRKVGDSPARGFYISAYNDEVNCGYRYDTNYDTATYPVTTEYWGWHHVECVMDRYGTATGTAGLYIFIDGVLQGSDTSLTVASAVNTDGVVIGDNSTTYEGETSVDNMMIYNYARTPAQIAWDYNQGKPLGWWKLDEGSGDTANNASEVGSTINGDLAGSGGSCPGAAACPTWTSSGKLNSALDFDGTDDYITTGDSTTFSGITNLTVSAWINQDTQTGTFDEIVNDFGTGSGDAKWWLSVTNASKNIEFGIQPLACDYAYDTPGKLSAPANGINTGQWYHVSATYDGSTEKIYINGDLAAYKPYTTGMNTCGGIVQIGTIDIDPNSSFWDGKIDDIRIWNYALTQEQIKNVYNEGAVRFTPVTGTP